MEAATPKRAVIRLAVLGTGVVMTVGMIVATVLLSGREEVAERPEWDTIETGDSYRLPTAEGAVTPVARLANPSDRRGYEPPAYAEPVMPAPPLARQARGPVMIHNPAAYGPPEDDSLPGIPTKTRVASRGPAGPRPAVALRTPPRALARAAVQAAPRQAAIPSFRASAQASTPVAPRSQPFPPDEPEESQAVDELAGLGYTLSTNELSKRLESDVQAAFRLGKSGAVYAARDRFERVLRRIALAKDAEEGSTRHTKALAEGLRALGDADDFLPRGDALETQLEVASIAESHGLEIEGEFHSPHEAIARYSHHAAQRLAEAAAGEPAGSMALYGLGKTYTRLESQGDLTAGRKSTVMFRAATETHPENYLAANELSVRLARDGHYEQASAILRDAAARPGAIAMIHANLAAIEQKLGRLAMAAAAQQQSEMLAHNERLAGEVSRRHGVQWVSPQDFQRMGHGPAVAGATPAPAAQQPVAVTPAAGQPTQQQPGGFSGWMRTAKRAFGWGEQAPGAGVAPAAGYGPPAVGPPQTAVR